MKPAPRAGCAALLCLAALGAAPAAPKAAAPAVTPRMLLETTDLSGVALSPDGAHVAFRTETASIERDTYDTAWYVMEVEGAMSALRIADGGAPLRSAAGFALAELPQWSADSRWLYYRALLDGAVQVWRAARDGSRAEPVTRDAANVERFVLDAAGGRLLYQVGAAREAIERAEMEEHDQGIRFDGTFSGQQPLFRGMPIDGRLASHRTLQGLGLLWDAPKTVRAVDTGTLQVVPASDGEAARLRGLAAPPGGAAAGARAVAVAPDGRWTAVLSGAYPDSELRVLAAGDGRAIACEACASLTIEAMAWRNGDELVFTARDTARDYAQSLHAWRVGRSAPRRIVASDGLLGGDRFGQGAACATGARYAVCVSASAQVAPRLERIDLDTGARTVLSDPNLRLSAAGRAETRLEFLSWKGSADKTFTGYLLTPAGRARGPRLPLFVTYFRCPGYLRGGYGDEWPLFSLAGSGMAVLCMSRPLRPSMWDQQAAEDYADALDGIRAAVDLLDARGVVDRARVGMGGMSYGGEVVAWVARNSDLLSAASVSNNQVSPMWYWFSAQVEGRADAIRQRWGLGFPDETPALWERLSPTSGTDRIEAPFLMQLPEAEYRANLEFHLRLLRSGRPTELWIFPGETHWKQRPRVKLAAYERNLDWFRFWLQGREDPAAAKAAQYARWRGMREGQCGRLAGRGAPWYCGR